jgi:iron complex outermembrane receptor protein
VQFFRPMWYAVGVRGRSTANPDAMLLLIDGRDATVEFLGQPLWAVQHFSMDDVERIEIIRGPGSALYGANAFTGVVQVITRKPGSGKGATFSVRSGEHGKEELSARGSARLGPVGLSVSAGVDREDRWTGRDLAARDVLHGRLDAEIQLAENTRLSLETGAFTGTGGFYFDLGEISLKDGYSAYGRVTFNREDLQVGVLYDHLQSGMDFDVKLYYQGLNLAEIPFANVETNKLAFHALHSLDFFFNLLTYGAEYVYNFHDIDALYEPQSYEHRAGVFFQDEVQLDALLKEVWDVDAPPLILTAGLRFDWNSQTDWELSPRAAVVGTPVENHSFRVGYAHAFLRPTYLESSLDIRLNDVSNLGFDRLTLANPDLENQTIDSLEIGYQGDFLDNRLQIRCDFAYNFYRKAILFLYDPTQMPMKETGGVQVPDIGGPGLEYDNEPDGYDGHDVDLQVTLRPAERSRVFFIAGYRQVFHSRTGRFSGGDPVWHLIAGADLSGRAGWTASARAYYTDPYDVKLNNPESMLAPNTTVRLPARWFLSARLAFQLASEPLDLTAGVEAFNLLNMRFREHGGLVMPDGPDFGAERLGRRVIVFLRGEI